MKQAENRVFTIPGVPGHDSCNLSGPGFCVPGSNAFVHGALSSELCRPAAKKGGKWLRGLPPAGRRGHTCRKGDTAAILPLFRNCAWSCPPAGGWVLRWENLGMLWGVDSRRETLCPQVSCERCGPRLPGSRRAFPKTEKASFSGAKKDGSMYHRFLSHLARFAIILTVLAGLIFIALGLCLAIFPAFLTVFVRIAGGILALFGLWALIGILGSLL